MAKENLVWLHGQVVLPPKAIFKPDGSAKQGSFALRVIRRPRTSDSDRFASKLYIDCPVVLSRDEKLIKQITGLSIGDMVDVRGVLSTREVVKKSTCPHCGHENKWEGNMIYVTPIYICRREEAVSDEEGLAFLKARSEVSNSCVMIGTLCRDVQYYKDEKNRTYAQYQLAVNRKYRIKEDPETCKTDYPWVKAFGKQALNDTNCLSTGSVIYLNGAIQTREVEREIVCEECMESYPWKDQAIEIVPYSTEYLANCKNPEDFEIDEGEENGETESTS